MCFHVSRTLVTLLSFPGILLLFSLLVIPLSFQTWLQKHLLCEVAPETQGFVDAWPARPHGACASAAPAFRFMLCGLYLTHFSRVLNKALHLYFTPRPINYVSAPLTPPQPPSYSSHGTTRLWRCCYCVCPPPPPGAASPSQHPGQ